MTLATQLPLGVTAVMLPELDFDEQIHLCCELGVTHYVYPPRIIADPQKNDPYSNWGNHKFDLTPQRLVDEGSSLAQKLRDAGMIPWSTVARATAGDDNDTLQVHLEGAAAGGCQNIRLSPRPYPAKLFDYPSYLKQVREDYERITERASALGLKVTIEMHAGTSACSPGLARAIMDGFDPAQLGLITDLPNMAREGEVKAVLGVSAIEPWIDHAHVGGNRRVAGERDAAGFVQTQAEMCALADSDLNVPAWIGCLAQLGRVVPMIIEDFSSELTGEARLRRSVAELKSLYAQLEKGLES